MSILLWIAEQLGLLALKTWLTPKDPEKERLHDAIEAKTGEAKDLAAPPLSKPDVIAGMQHRLDDTTH